MWDFDEEWIVSSQWKTVQIEVFIQGWSPN